MVNTSLPPPDPSPSCAFPFLPMVLRGLGSASDFLIQRRVYPLSLTTGKANAHSNLFLLLQVAVFLLNFYPSCLFSYTISSTNKIPVYKIASAYADYASLSHQKLPQVLPYFLNQHY